MAEKPEWVAGFDRPKGTEIKHIRGSWYLYERSWRYDPSIRRSRKVSGRCLGKITPEGLVPSVSRAERARKAEVRISDVVEIGASSLAWTLTAGMRERLGRHFPARWREIYALAVVRAVRDPALRRSAAHLEDSALWEALGRPHLTPQGISSLLRELGRSRAEVCSCMRESLAADGRFLLFDGHRLLSASRGSDLAELGYDSKMRFRPQVNLLYAFSVGEGGAVPAYYKRYSGGTADVSAFSDLVAEAGIAASGCLAVADKGFSSEADFALLSEMGLGYVVPLRRGSRFVKGRIPEGPAGWDTAFTYNGRGISCMTVREDGFNVHVYLDTELYQHEFSDACARLEGASDARAAKRDAELKRRARGSGRLTDAELAALGPVDISAALGDRSEMGTVAIRTDRTDLSASAVYGIYKQRQAVEQFFKTYGDTLGMDATWMKSDEATEGLLFLNHLSAVIATDMLEAISAAGHSRDVSYKDCIQMLRKVRACRMSDGSWQAVPVQKRVAALCGKLGIDPSDLSLLEAGPGMPT
ncbi:MAG: transposase [Atopobiaceae bacterium]|jgi:hypothetical protein|nr:transposase [Atopobiaceae bacterium]MCI1540143.1 transposase [Atopobiaceae bacterium]